MALKHYPSLWHPYQTIHNRQLTDKPTDFQYYPKIMFQYFTSLEIRNVEIKTGEQISSIMNKFCNLFIWTSSNTGIMVKIQLSDSITILRYTAEYRCVWLFLMKAIQTQLVVSRWRGQLGDIDDKFEQNMTVYLCICVPPGPGVVTCRCRWKIGTI